MKTLSKGLLFFLIMLMSQLAQANGIVEKAFNIMSSLAWVPVVITIIVCLAHFHEHGGNWSPKYIFKSVVLGACLTILLFAPNDAYNTVTDEGQRMMNGGGRFYRNSR